MIVVRIPHLDWPRPGLLDLYVTRQYLSIFLLSFPTGVFHTVLFSVDFQPSGVLFSKSSPAQLAIWYQNANPDLNGDGVVDALDEALKEQLAIWYRGTKADPWRQVWSKNDTTQELVTAALYHFSQYAVSW